MTIIMVMQETLPLAEIKAHLSEIVDRAPDSAASIRREMTRNAGSARSRDLRSQTCHLGAY